MIALELLLTSDRDRARQLAAELDAHNAERQQVEERIIAEALNQARTREADRVLVVSGEGWHVGVIGIVASRIQQEFYRPAVVIGIDKGVGKGSCRSITGFSIVAALGRCASLLERFGGHEMAAGLSVRAGQIEALRQALNAYATATMQEQDYLPTVHVDAEIQLAELGEDLLRALEQLEPCGAGNPTPIFAASGLRLRGTPRVVGKGHWKFQVTDGERTLEAIWFGAADRELPRTEFDIAFLPEANEYGGERTLQLRVRDVRAQP